MTLFLNWMWTQIYSFIWNIFVSLFCLKSTWNGFLIAIQIERCLHKVKHIATQETESNFSEEKHVLLGQLISFSCCNYYILHCWFCFASFTLQHNHLHVYLETFSGIYCHRNINRFAAFVVSFFQTKVMCDLHEKILSELY